MSKLNVLLSQLFAIESELPLLSSNVHYLMFVICILPSTARTVGVFRRNTSIKSFILSNAYLGVGARVWKIDSRILWRGTRGDLPIQIDRTRSTLRSTVPAAIHPRPLVDTRTHRCSRQPQVEV